MGKRIKNQNRFILNDIGEFLEKLSEKSDSVYWLSSPDFKKIQYISPAYERIWGRPREVLYANPEVWVTYLYPEDVRSYHPIHAMAERIAQLGPAARLEETYRIIRPDGEIRWIVDRGFPIYNEDGTCCGVTGVAIDITAQKEAEKLKFEHEVQKKLALEQDKFVKMANQVAHDIRSPVASLLMILKSCQELPENDRIALREAAISIGDIANHLLNKYQQKETHINMEERQPILVSSTLLQLLTDKKYQYQDLAVKFTHNFMQQAYFAFIKIEPSSFKRMISNIINNAVDAFDKKNGKIIVTLNVNNEWVNILIEDNGKGMPVEVIKKILNNIAVTAGKEAGHGIGLTQARETLQRNQGEISIDSELGKGTTVKLTFPRIHAPHWIAEEIKLNKTDIVIILDDDNSIHGAWKTRFESILTEAPTIKLHHFTIAKDVLTFFNNFSSEEKKQVFLLTDYELLKQELNGLHVIAKTNIKRSLLVTSHYIDPIVQEQAAKTGTKILPKQLASEIPIKINNIKEFIETENSTKRVDIVLVEDNENFVKTLVAFVFRKRVVDSYHNPHDFLNNVDKYNKNTKILLDNNFDNSNLRGIEIAAQLHEKGYTQLYLLSGEVFKSGEIPDYLPVIIKTDIDSIAKL